MQCCLSIMYYVTLSIYMTLTFIAYIFHLDYNQ